MKSKDKDTPSQRKYRRRFMSMVKLARYAEETWRRAEALGKVLGLPTRDKILEQTKLPAREAYEAFKKCEPIQLVLARKAAADARHAKINELARKQAAERRLEIKKTKLVEVMKQMMELGIDPSTINGRVSGVAQETAD